MNEVRAIVVRGHRVASGASGDSRFPGGTLRMQLPFFRERGLDLGSFHLATLNLSVAPLRFETGKPAWHFTGVDWHSTEPEEDFSFFDCRVRRDAEPGWVEGLVYYPRPETKPEHQQPPDVLEVILRERIEGIDYGNRLLLEIPEEQIRFRS